MKYKKVLPSAEFIRCAKPLLKKYKSLKSELKIFESDILSVPESGEPLGKSRFKIRISIASKGKGKSGGARIVYLLYPPSSSIFLITIFDKSSIENVSVSYLDQVVKELKKDNNLSDLI